MANLPVCRLSCRVAWLEDATHDIRVMRLEIMAGGPFQFAAGQYASVTLDALPPRDYSMANRPAMAKLGIPLPPELLDYAPIPSSLAQKWKEQIEQGQQLPPEVQKEMERLSAWATMLYGLSRRR